MSAFYDMSFEPKYPDDVLDTISKYDVAKKYVAMYQYVVYSEYDSSVIESKIVELEKEKASLEEQLLAGYDLELSVIYELEDAYLSTCTKLEDYKKSLVSYEISTDEPVSEDVPTYEEYVDAIQVKKRIDELSDIGNVDKLSFPVSGAHLISEKTNTGVLYSVIDGSSVTSLFNGEVVNINGGDITLNHHNGIYTFYGNLSSVVVSEGDIVKQGDLLGKSSNTLLLKCKVNNKLVDVSKLFVKE